MLGFQFNFVRDENDKIAGFSIIAQTADYFEKYLTKMPVLFRSGRMKLEIEEDTLTISNLEDGQDIIFKQDILYLGKLKKLLNKYAEYTPILEKIDNGYKLVVNPPNANHRS